MASCSANGKRALGEILRKLCEWKGVKIIEAECCFDHIHMLVEIPPKMSVSSFVGYLKGKSSLMINAFRWLRERSDRNSKPPAMPVEPKTLYIKNTFSIKRSCSSSRPQSKRCFLWQKNKIWHIRNGCVSTILSSHLSIGENLSMGNTVKRLEEFCDSYAVTKAWRFWKGI